MAAAATIAHQVSLPLNKMAIWLIFANGKCEEKKLLLSLF